MDPFEQIAVRTMVPYSHLLWSACWTGTAAAALGRARAMLRQRERKSPGGNGPGTARLARAYGRLQLVSTLVRDIAGAIDRDDDGLTERWNTALILDEGSG